MADRIEVVEGSDGQPIIRVHESPHWQRDPPEEDGWYVAVDADGIRCVSELARTKSGERYAVYGSGRQRQRVILSGWLGLVDEIADVSWWLVPALDLPPIPEEEP